MKTKLVSHGFGIISPQNVASYSHVASNSANFSANHNSLTDNNFSANQNSLKDSQSANHNSLTDTNFSANHSSLPDNLSANHNRLTGNNFSANHNDLTLTDNPSANQNSSKTTKNYSNAAIRSKLENLNTHIQFVHQKISHHCETTSFTP